MPRIGALALVLFALAGRGEAAWECRTAHFRVLSEPGAEVARAAADRLEAVRKQFEALGLALPDRDGEPVVVLIFSARESLDPYAPEDARDPALTRGLSLAGEDRRWILVVWDAPGSPLAALAHEYAHLVRQDAADPLWFREGFAEYLAGLEAGGGAPFGPSALHHLRLLHELAWTNWDELLAAGRMSAAFARQTFYAQAWLAVHWTVAQGTPPADLHPEDFETVVRTQGSEQVGLRLREFAALLWREATATTAPKPSEEQEPAAMQLPGVRPAADWELPFWEAELHREQQHFELAQPVLERIERQYPRIPEPSEALGALAMAQGRYDLAEEKLRSAIRKGASRPLTHHRYSLVLLRPFERGEDGPAAADAMDRVQTAVLHARKAREGDLGEPRYLLGEAQALGVAGLWDEAVRSLTELQSFAGWRERAEVEFAELLRRRQQAMRSVERPRLPPDPPAAPGSGGPGSALLAAWLDPPPPHVPKPEPPPPPKLVWPPPGTILLYGYINGVDCRAGERIVSVRTPRFTIELRERAAAPAKLYHPPLPWDELPCGLRGYEVNVAYRPLPAGSEVRGELVAVVF